MARGPERVGPEAFDGDHLRRPGTAVVAFLADWCPFCRAFEPAFTGLASDGSFRELIADVTDDASPLWDRFRLEVLPTVIVFRDGGAVFRVDAIPGRGLSGPDLEAIVRACRPAPGRPAGAHRGP